MGCVCMVILFYTFLYVFLHVAIWFWYLHAWCSLNLPGSMVWCQPLTFWKFTPIINLNIYSFIHQQIKGCVARIGNCYRNVGEKGFYQGEGDLPWFFQDGAKKEIRGQDRDFFWMMPVCEKQVWSSQRAICSYHTYKGFILVPSPWKPDMCFGITVIVWRLLKDCSLECFSLTH